MTKPTIYGPRTDVAKRRVCVRVDSFKFPEDCLVCGGHDAAKTRVEFKAVLLAGVVAGGETTTLEIPLCNDCAQNYLRAKWKTNAWMTACFILGFGLIAVGMMLQEIAPKAMRSVPNELGVAAAVFAVVMILSSFVLLLTKNRNFPITLVHRGWIFRDDVHHVLIFHNDESMKRFVAANAERMDRVEA